MDLDTESAKGTCNICGGVEFGPGPGGRMSTTGKLPYCLKCGSLERHRTSRQAWLDIKGEDFSSWSMLQFSRDSSVDQNWFKTFELSEYGAGGHLDLMKISRPSHTYDAVICNHVIEHVQYDNAAMHELARIIKPTGFVFLTFPDPMNRPNTVEWPEPRADQYGHWRVYGRDVEERFRTFIPMYGVYYIFTEDSVTGAKDIAYYIVKSKTGAERLKSKLPMLLAVNEPSYLIEHASAHP